MLNTLPQIVVIRFAVLGFILFKYKKFIEVRTYLSMYFTET